MQLIPTFSKDARVDKSLGHSVKDGVAYAMMSGFGESYFSAFAIFLKATTPQIAILASLPPLLASSAQLLAVYIGQHTGARKNVIIIGAVIQLCALALIAAMPVFFPAHGFVILIGLVVFYFAGSNLGAPLWGSLMGAIVPTGIRGRFFATRTKMSSIASFSALILAGIILQAFHDLSLTYYGFLSIFLLGVIARIVSVWHLSQQHDPPHLHALDGDVINLFNRRFFKGESKFLRFSLFHACMQSAVAVSGPLVVIYLLRVLEYSYLELTINTAASVVMQFLVLNRWGRLSDLFGNRIILRSTGFIIPFVPLLWILSSDFFYLILVQAISGLIWSGFSLSASNFVYDLTTQQKRAGLMSVHAMVAAAAVFLGASIGGLLAVTLPSEIRIAGTEYSWQTAIYGVFFVSAMLRLIVAAAFLPRLQEVRDVKSMTYHGLLFRVTRFSPISGVIFDVVTRLTKKEADEIADEND